MMKKFIVLAFVIVFSPMRAVAEPDANNNCSSATPISFNEAIYPSLNPSDDPEDYFSLTVPVNYFVSLSLGTDVPNPCIVSWKLYEEGGDCSVIKSSGQIDKYMGNTWGKIIEEPGNYKLHIMHGGGATGDSQFYMEVQAQQKVSIEYIVKIDNPDDKQAAIRMNIRNLSSDIFELYEEIPHINVTDFIAKDQQGNVLVVDHVTDICNGCPHLRRIHCKDVAEVFIDYTIEPEFFDSGGGRVGYSGYIGSDFALFWAKGLLLNLVDWKFIDSLTVSFELPENWKVVSHWQMIDGIFHPLNSKAINQESVFMWSVIALGHFDIYSKTIGKTDVTVAGYQGWPIAFKEYLSKKVWDMYTYEESVFRTDSLQEPYMVVFTPPASDGKTINSVYGEYGQIIPDIEPGKDICFHCLNIETIEQRWISFDWGIMGWEISWRMNGFAYYYGWKTTIKAHMEDSSLALEGFLDSYNYLSECACDDIPLGSIARDGNKFLAYMKGALAVCLLAKEIYSRSNGKITLDDFMKLLLNKYWFKGIVLTDDDLKSNLAELTGKDFSQFFEDYIYSLAPLPGKEWAYGDDDNDGHLNVGEILWDTDPNKADTDGDGYPDKEEIDAGTDPTDQRSCPGPCPDLAMPWIPLLLLDD